MTTMHSNRTARRLAGLIALVALIAAAAATVKSLMVGSGNSVRTAQALEFVSLGFEIKQVTNANLTELYRGVDWLTERLQQSGAK